MGHWFRSISPYVQWPQQIQLIKKAFSANSHWTRDDSQGTVSHHGLVNVSQQYEVNALYTPTFQLSLLSINQLDTARYTSTFRCGKYYISSPSITITGNRVNDLNIISPATALTLTCTPTTSRRRNWQREWASPSTHTSVPQSPPTTKSSKPTRKSLTISESWLWHRCLANIHPTALRSLIDGYTKDHSMFTACIQAKHKQKIIKVMTKRTTQPFQLIHSDVCEQFSTPTSAGHRYYIQFIDDYTRYTSIWVLPDQKSKTCTSAYQSFQARVHSMEYKAKRFRWDDGHGEHIQHNLPTSAHLLRNNIRTMPSPRSPKEWSCWMHDPEHHRESAIYDDWLPGAPCLLGRGSQHCSLPPSTNAEWRPNKKRQPQRLSSTISNFIRDAACIWQALSQHWRQWKLVQRSSTTSGNSAAMPVDQSLSRNAIEYSAQDPIHVW